MPSLAWRAMYLASLLSVATTNAFWRCPEHACAAAGASWPRPRGALAGRFGEPWERTGGVGGWDLRQERDGVALRLRGAGEKSDEMSESADPDQVLQPDAVKRPSHMTTRDPGSQGASGTAGVCMPWARRAGSPAR